MLACRTAVIMLAALVAGCSADLKVFDANQKEVAGVPFKSPETWVKEGLRNRHSKLGTECTPTPFVEFLPLPTGPQYYVNVDADPLVKSKFGLKLTESGTMQEVSLESDPSPAIDAIKASTEAIKSILPLAAGVAGGPAARLAPNDARPACDAGEANIQLTSFDEYRARGR